jgi:hypothetical protein
LVYKKYDAREYRNIYICGLFEVFMGLLEDVKQAEQEWRDFFEEESKEGTKEEGDIGKTHEAINDNYTKRRIRTPMARALFENTSMWERTDSVVEGNKYLSQFGPMGYEKIQQWYGEVSRHALDRGFGESDGTVLVLEHPLRNRYKANILEGIPFKGGVFEFDPEGVFEKYQPKPQTELPEVLFLIMEGREVNYELRPPLMEEK